MATDKILGVVVFARHGDRQGFYQDPETYTASSTVITPLGEVQEFQLGSLLRSLYLNASAPTVIQGVSNSDSIFQPNQVVVRADAGGEGGVIFDSAVALTQGLWPVTPRASTQLANGTNVTSPLGGYQYVPIESVEPNQDVSLEGYTSCNTFDEHTQEFYNSSAFQEKASEAEKFLNDLEPYMDGRPVTLQNMWNVFDYMNVQSIHNASFANALPSTYLAQARDLANWHEYNVFSDDTTTGIGNIAFRTMLPSVITAVQRIANASDPLKIHYSAIAYKPFLSLFNMTGVVADGALPPTIVDYAASVVLEVRQPASSSEPVLRFTFKNGTTDASFSTYPMRFADWDGSARAGSDVPVSTFIGAFQPAAVNTTLDWCNVCAQTQARGCAALLGAPTHRQHHQRISPVGAGFLGAGLTAAVLGLTFAMMFFGGYMTLGKKRRAAPSTRIAPHDHVELESAHTHSLTKEGAQ